MRTKLLLAACLALLIVGCSKREKSAAGTMTDKALQAASVETVTSQEPDETVEAAIDPIDDSVRLVERSNAIADLIAAHQKISRDEGYAIQFKGFISAASDPSEIANLQDDLSEIRNDIRDLKAELPKLEEKAEALSRDGDPPYRVEVARFNADLAAAIRMAAHARREGSANSAAMDAVVDTMQKLDAESVLAGKYPKQR